MKPVVRYTWRAVALALVGSLQMAACQAGEPRPRPRPGPRRPESPPARVQPNERFEPAGQPPAQITGSSRLQMLSDAGGAKTIAMEFYGLDIDHVLRLLSYAAQVTIVKSPDVSGPITVIAPEPVPLDVAFQILDSVLQVRGFTMIQASTGIYKVVPIPEAIQSGVPLHFGKGPGAVPSGDDLRTQVIPLVNLDANEMAAQLQGLLSQNASVIPTSTNSLIITDTATNIGTAVEIIAEAEGQLSSGFKVYSLQYYDATEMADLVTGLVLSKGGAAGAAGRRPAWELRAQGRRPVQPQRGQPRPTTQPATGSVGPEFAYPDTRTNSLIVLATPIHMGQISDLITQLDRPVSLRDAFFVYPVQNLVASELANLLAPLIGAEVTGGSQQAGAGTTARSRTTPTSSQRQSYTRPFSNQGSAFRTSNAGQTSGPLAIASLEGPASRLQVEPLAGQSGSGLQVAQAPPAGATPATAPVPPTPAVEPVPPMGEVPIPGGYDETTQVTGAGVAQAMIAADDNTNTLLISAPPEQVDLIQQMLDKLDILPPQVHIRAIIAEVELKRDTSLGFQWQSLGRTWGVRDGTTYTGDVGSNFGVNGPTENSTPTGFFATLSGTEFTAVLNALTTDSNSRILSAPSIFTTNNQEATIDISQQLPFPTGTFQTTTDVGTISTSITYRSVGIVLTVTPRVTQGDVVRMEIQISANTPGSETQVAGLSYPTFSQRLATAVLNVKDGNTIVLGGLMKEDIGRSASRVPILGDLPLLGALFRSTRSTRTKSELLLFLTPQVVRTAGEAGELTDREKQRLPDIPRSVRGPSARSEAVQPEVAIPSEKVQPTPEVPVVEPPVVGGPVLQEEPAEPLQPGEMEVAPEEEIEMEGPDIIPPSAPPKGPSPQPQAPAQVEPPTEAQPPQD